MKVQGYEQLRLHDVDWSYYDNRDGKKWAGKVVDKVGFVNRGSHSEQMLLIFSLIRHLSVWAWNTKKTIQVTNRRG